MLGLILASAIARAAARKIGEEIIDNAGTIAAAAIPVAAAGAAVAIGAVAAESSDKKEQVKLNETARRQALQQQQYEARRQAQNNAIRQEEMKKTAINDLYTKFSMCCYLAWADGKLSDEEKHNLNAIFMDIYKDYPDDRVKAELLKIYNTPNLNFITLERYLHNSSPDTIASFLELAEEIAESDLVVSEAEKKRLYKLRKYLTDRTGKNYMRNKIQTNASVSLICPGCQSTMVIKDYDNKLVCPFCGSVKYINVS